MNLTYWLLDNVFIPKGNTLIFDKTIYSSDFGLILYMIATMVICETLIIKAFRKNNDSFFMFLLINILCVLLACWFSLLYLKIVEHLLIIGLIIAGLLVFIGLKHIIFTLFIKTKRQQRSKKGKK